MNTQPAVLLITVAADESSPMSPSRPTPITPAGRGHTSRSRLAAVPAASVRSDDELDTRAGPAPPCGFVLYVGLSETATRETGVSLERIAHALRMQVNALLPAAETSTTLVTEERPGRSRGPGAPERGRAHTRTAGDALPVRLPARGVVIDHERWQVHVDGRPVALAPLADLLAARHLLETVEKYVNDAC